MSETLRGVVKWFNDAKGFGFIEHPSGRDVFVHYSVIDQKGYKSLKDGEEVEYEIREGGKGLHASKVVRTDAPLQQDEMQPNDSQESGGKPISYDIPAFSDNSDSSDQANNEEGSDDSSDDEDSSQAATARSTLESGTVVGSESGSSTGSVSSSTAPSSG